MSEGSDYEPAPHWKGHDFKSAKASYDVHANRSYNDAIAAGRTASDLLPETLTTNSPAPVVINCDDTGSMGDKPSFFFSKAPYLEHEAHEYLGKGMEMSFGIFNDAETGARYPVQARPFAKGADVADRLKELVIQSGGGGNMCESSELSALYAARNIKMPKAVKKPIYIFITDEMPYDYVTVARAKQVHVKLQETISTKEIFDELKQKFSVYLVLAPYNSSKNENDPTSQSVRREWQKYLDDEFIASLPEAARVVDIIFGIFAKETGRVPYFRDELVGRQRPDQIATVFKALKTVHAGLAPVGGAKGTQKKLPAKSTLHKPGKGGKKSGDLV